MDNKLQTCDPCSLDDAIQDATSFCVVYVERLCDDCVKFHGKNKATRKHKILTGDDVPIETDTFRLLAESAFCQAHPEREIQFKCEDHDEYICGICARKAHRHCEHTEEIDKELDEIKAREECQITLNSSKDLSDKQSIAKKEIEEIIEKALQGKGQAIEERKILFQSIYDIITKLETESYTEIDIIYDDHINIFRGKKETITAVEQQQTNNQTLLDITLKYADTRIMEINTNRTARQLKIAQRTISDHANNPMQAPIPTSTNFLETLIKHLVKVVKTELPENQTSDEELIENEGVFSESVIHGSDEYASCTLEDDDKIHTSQSDGSLGVIRITSLQDIEDKRDYEPKGDKEQFEAVEKVNDEHILKQTTVKQTMSLMERNVWLANVQQYDDSGFPLGCVILQDGRLVTIGTKLWRPIMSVYNENMMIIFESILDHMPIDICCLGEKEVAITYFDYKRIDKFLILENKIETHGGFPTKLYGRSITKHGNDIAVLFADEKGNIEVTSKNDTVEIQIRRNDGKIIDTIDKFHKDMLNVNELSIKNPVRILSLPNEDILIGEKTHLRCFNIDGGCRWYLRSYKDQAVNHVLGTTTDTEGNILVCGAVSNNVHQLCVNNYRQNRIIIDSIDKPLCIAYDAGGERIIVGCLDHVIRVFKFI